MWYYKCDYIFNLSIQILKANFRSDFSTINEIIVIKLVYLDLFFLSLSIVVIRDNDIAHAMKYSSYIASHYIVFELCIYIRLLG